MGQYSCILYNLYVSASVTTQGRSAISAAGLQFEMFLANNVKFGSLTEIVTFIDNVIYNEERKYSDKNILDDDITLEECFYKLMITCGFHYIPTEKDMLIVWEILCNVKQEDLNRLYYKNNLYSFMDNKSMTKAIEYMLSNLHKPFLNPNKIPNEIKPELEEFCDILMEYVYYSHQVIDRLDRYRTMSRDVCIITDTDSIFGSFDPWYRYTLEKVKDIPMSIKNHLYKPLEEMDKGDYGNYELRPALIPIDNLDYNFYDDEEVQIEKSINPLVMIPQEGLRFSIINIMAYCMGIIINDYMVRYTKNSHSYSPDRKCLLVMKNEFLVKRLMLIMAMKNYAAKMLLQEGNIVPEKSSLEIKGLPITKSSTNARTQQKMKEIIYEQVLNTDNLDQVLILKELAIFEKEIYNSLKKGKKDFYSPRRIKSMNSYEDPLRIYGIKQCIVWNTIRTKEIPAIDFEQRNSVDIVKVSITPKNVHVLKDTNEEIYVKLTELMKEKAFAGGIEGLAIPKDSMIPEYMIQFIDYTTIINDNLKLFPLEVLGMYRGNDNNNISNIVKL